MANRHLSRSIVLQSLFEKDLRNDQGFNLEDSIIRNATEFASGVADAVFIKKLIDTIVSKQSDIDKIIQKAAPDWPIEKISTIDRNILRIGLAELLFSDREEVPSKVAINEAIELAKNFGGESSGKFVNGVLGAVYKELGEPGKDEKTSKKRREIPFEEMKIEKKAGAVVYSVYNGEVYLAFVHDVFGHWTLSKGGVEEGELIEDGTKRAIKEEIGLDIEIIEKVGENEYVANHPEKGQHRKQVVYFLAKSEYKDLKLEEDSGGLDDAKWFKISEILDLNFYDDILPIVISSVKKIAEKKNFNKTKTVA
ncbi:MAG TPA: transcription antitermination factor NusB [Candidatus Paceibacterota bacterium]|nr:transcription antitermination factor NusB [Candidatus Paceibacterota bacterium]HMP18804.1 transcription antitermination factor NusB [Candidatus Paceibacterota bacterium]HMP85299.1 transcription antitermination factor NusB [Candidatus Paceibacterota bacterium]